MYCNDCRHYGFTIIEILIVISLIAAIAGFAIAGFQNFAIYQQYNEAVGNVKSTLNQSRVSARSAIDDQTHGIKFSSNSLTQYIGDTYTAGNPTNEVVTYNLVTIQVDLTGGVDEIVFSKLSGLPSATGTVIVSGNKFSASTTIKISDSGVIQ